MKVEVTIWDSSCNCDEDDYNFIAFIASKFSENPPTNTSKG